jgi:predicted MFS family arabinose efflux permease
VTLICNLARMTGTAVNGPINTLSGSYETAFDLAALVAVLAIGIMLFIPERTQPPRAPAPRRLLALFVRPDVLGPALLNLVLHYGDWSATYSFIPILARQYGASDVLVSFLTSANLGVVALGNITVTWLGARLRFWPMLALSLGLVAAGLGLAAVAPALAVVIAAQLLIGLGFGIAYPVLLGACIRRVDSGERTTAMGLNQAVYAAGMFAGPWLSGILANALGVQPMFAVTAVVVLAAGLGGVRALRARIGEQ